MVANTGLCELGETMEEGELAVFFRNNHFSTILKRQVRHPVCKNSNIMM